MDLLEFELWFWTLREKVPCEQVGWGAGEVGFWSPCRLQCVSWGWHHCWCFQEFVRLFVWPEHTQNANIEAFYYLPFTWKFLLSHWPAFPNESRGGWTSLLLYSQVVYNPEAEGLQIAGGKYAVKGKENGETTLLFLSLFCSFQRRFWSSYKARIFWNEKPTVSVVSHFQTRKTILALGYSVSRNTFLIFQISWSGLLTLGQWIRVQHRKDAKNTSRCPPVCLLYVLPKMW